MRNLTPNYICSMLKISLGLLLTFTFLSFSNSLHAGKIEKGFERLEIYDYFKAKEYFEKSVKRHPSPASYGLAIIYYRQDNPFHDLDSAHRYIRLAESTFNDEKAKHRAKWKPLGYSMKAILQLKAFISEKEFEKMQSVRDPEEWTAFIESNQEFKKIKRATFIRDSLVFAKVLKRNKSRKYQEFLDQYPDSPLKDVAQDHFYRAQYYENTASHNILEYQNFLKNFPENPYVRMAQDEIYSRSTEVNTVDALKRFIETNPGNRNINEAWRRLYQVFMYEYSEDRIELFQTQFPNYPFKKDLAIDIEMSRRVLIPAVENEKFGAMDLNGNMIIPAKYELFGFFHEGLAMVQLNGKYGFVNKAEQLVIPCQFDYVSDFENGRAVIETEEGVGLIDRTGKIILKPVYEDVGMFSNRLIYAQLDGKYGYYDRYGELRIPHKFDEAFTFIDGKAKVEVDGKYTFINEDGDLLLPAIYDNIEAFDNDHFVVDSNGIMGIIDLTGKFLVKPTYEEIGKLSNGLAMVILDDKLGYIDSTGKVVIEMNFEVFPNCMEIGEFRPYSAMAKFDGKYGLIDRFGKFVVPNVYQRLGEFSAVLSFSKGKLWGFIDLNNKVILPPKYDWAESFKNGGAIVDKGGKQGVINISGEEIIPIDKDEVLRLDPSRYQVEENQRFGVYGANGELLVPVRYMEIRQLNKDFYVLRRGNGFDYLYLPTNRIVRIRQ
mgnify:CR=1 FL=1